MAEKSCDHESGTYDQPDQTDFLKQAFDHMSMVVLFWPQQESLKMIRCVALVWRPRLMDFRHEHTSDDRLLAIIPYMHYFIVG